MTALLFIHGAPGDARVWSPVLEGLSPGLDARAITLSYFGGGNWPDDGAGFSTELHAGEIAHFIEATMKPPVSIVAWSYGVHPTLLAALRRPDLIRALLLHEPGSASYVDDPADRGRFAEDAGAAFGPIGRALAQGGKEAAVAALVDASGGPGCFAAMPEERRRLYLESAGMMPLLLGGGQPPAEIGAADLSDLAIATTVLLGEASRPVFAIPSRALAKALPKAHLQLVSGADHMLPETDPARFSALVEEWMTQQVQPA